MEADDAVVPMSALTHVVGPKGVSSSESGCREDCVIAAELLRPVL